MEMRSLMTRMVGYGTAMAGLAIAFTTQLSAVHARVEAPEIDGGSISAGVSLLAAGVMLVRARMRSK
jgi:hypothetical protein